MTQLIKLTKILLPVIINVMKDYHLLKLTHDILSLCVVALLEVKRHTIYHVLVGKRNEYALKVNIWILIYLLNDWCRLLCNLVHVSLEVLHYLLERYLLQLVSVNRQELILCERWLHEEELQELLLATIVVIIIKYRQHAVPYRIGDIHANALTHQGVTALLVYHGTLLVHHIVILKQTLTYAEVILLHLLLCTLYGTGNH